AGLARFSVAGADSTARGSARLLRFVPAVIVRTRNPGDPLGGTAPVTLELRRGTNDVQAAAASIASTSRRVQSFTSETNARDRDTGPRVPRRHTARRPRARPPRAPHS